MTGLSLVGSRGSPPQIDYVNGVEVQVDIENDAVISNSPPPGCQTFESNDIAGKWIRGKGGYRGQNLRPITGGDSSGCFFDALCDA